jgi:prepilin-type processing-associated H-X9-DG protein
MIQELGFKRVNLTKNDLMYTESKARIGRLMKTEESNVSFADGSV